LGIFLLKILEVNDEIKLRKLERDQIMEICILIPSFLPTIGGAEIGAYELAKQLYRKGHRISVIAPKYKKGWRNYEKIEGIDVYRYPLLLRLPRLTELIRVLFSFLFIGNLLRKIRPDVLNMHYVVPTGFAGQFWANKLHLPTVLTLIGNDVYDPYRPLSKLYYPFMKKVMRQTNFITALSSFVKNVLLNEFDVPENKIRIIPYGIEIDKFHPNVDGTDTRRKYNISDNEKLIITVQRLHPRKGVQYFIKAAREVLRKMDNVKFLVIGNGQEQEYLIDLSNRLKLTGKVIFTGEIENSRLNKYYAAADLFAFHTIHEGLGIVLLEAIASGKPVVTTTAGGTVDVVRDGVNGLLVPPEDSNALANAILKLLAKPGLMEETGKAGRRIAEREFNWSLIADRYLGVFELAKKSKQTTN